MAEYSPEYIAYLKSAKWKKMRDSLLRLADFHCQECSKPKLPSKLHIHHLTYERLGNEYYSDVIVLCEDCHDRADEIRKRQTQARYEDHRYESRLDGWASKVYGEEWFLSHDSERVEEEFDAWLERHSNDHY